MSPFLPPADKERHDRLVALVGRILGLCEQAAAAKAPHDRDVLQRQITTTERQIDQLVCELFCLTEDQIRVVESAVK